MTNYKIFKVIGAVSATTQSTFVGEYPTGNEPNYAYRTTWGIMVASGSVGYVSMSGGGAINLAHIAPGQPMVCAPSFVSCSSGTVYVLG